MRLAPKGETEMAAKTKRKKQTNRKPVKRQTRRFQLRLEHPVDAHVKEILDYERTKRKELETIRNGVTLYYALEQGDLKPLFEMFPQYKSQFNPDTAAALAEFMEILQRQQAAPAPAPALMGMQPVGQGSKQLLGFKALAAPVFNDDDDLVIETEKGDGKTAVNNFMRSMGMV